MSDRLLSGRLPGPVTGRPRRPLSNRASTASWSMRFSLLTMISGAPRSSSRFSRLLRLMTRRYRSFRSLVGRDHRDAAQHHAERRVAPADDGRHHPQPLDGELLLLPLGGGDDLAEA